MKRSELFLKLKPVLKRLLAAAVICSPVVGLTNGLQRSKAPEVRVEKKVQAGHVRIVESVTNDRCLRIESPTH